MLRGRRLRQVCAAALLLRLLLLSLLLRLLLRPEPLQVLLQRCSARQPLLFTKQLQRCQQLLVLRGGRTVAGRRQRRRLGSRRRRQAVLQRRVHSVHVCKVLAVVPRRKSPQLKRWEGRLAGQLRRAQRPRRLQQLQAAGQRLVEGRGSASAAALTSWEHLPRLRLHLEPAQLLRLAAAPVLDLRGVRAVPAGDGGVVAQHAAAAQRSRAPAELPTAPHATAASPAHLDVLHFAAGGLCRIDGAGAAAAPLLGILLLHQLDGALDGLRASRWRCWG